MILEALFVTLAFTASQEGAPIPEPPAAVAGDCSADPAALAAEAGVLLANAGSAPDAATLRRARDLLRRARKGAPSVALDLRSA
ncbi:MAG TPA: hypothetical protein VGO79_10585, partial [Thermoanaerobaculia bacterium]